MARYFNTAGPCRPGLHYMLSAERRLPAVAPLIDRQQYFVVHAPRQSGKTTTCRALAGALTASGRYAALLTTCETGQRLLPDIERSVAALLDTLRQQAEEHLPVDLRPPAADPTLPAETRLRDLLVRWARQAPRPVVLFLDEIDALKDDALISVLRQLRSGYDERPTAFPQSVALIGLRDVRDYRLAVRPDDQSLGTSSPFNILVESLTLRNFTAEELCELYGQHTAETGQPFTPEALALAHELTRGQPWLANALARQAVEQVVPDPTRPVTAVDLESAKEILIQRRDTHLDSLVDRLREPRVQRVIAPLLAGDLLQPEVLDDDIQLALDLGLVVAGPDGLEIANAIYREVIPRALTAVLEHSLPVVHGRFVGAGGGLDTRALLTDFRRFWCENAEAFLARSPYSEAAAQLVFMAFLHKVVNGGGFIDREFAVGRGRIDLCVRWPHPRGVQRWAVELKVWRDGRPDPLREGVERLAAYLDRLGLDEGTLILFDSRRAAPALPERCSESLHEERGRRILVVRL